MRSVPLWTEAEQQAFIETRVQLHQVAEALSDDKLPLCSEAERWAKPPVFAVMKPGRKTAVRLFESRAHAERMVTSLPDHTITERPGLSMRCERYCSVSDFCNQYQESRSAA